MTLWVQASEQPTKPCCAGFEVLTGVVMKSSIFWDVTPCSPLKLKRRFGETCGLHLQGRRIGLARNQRKSKWQEKPAWLILRPWRRRRHVPPKHRLTFKELHGVICWYQRTRCLHIQVVGKLKCWEAPHVIIRCTRIVFFCRPPVPQKSSCPVVSLHLILQTNTTARVTYVNTMHFDIHTIKHESFYLL
jgi:hypothetical protein